jgi:hypothetical protein
VNTEQATGSFPIMNFQNLPANFRPKNSITRTIYGPEDPTGNPKEVTLLLKMEEWLLKYHKGKIA